MAGIPVDSTALAAFDVQELTADTFDAGIQSAGVGIWLVGFSCVFSMSLNFKK